MGGDVCSIEVIVLLWLYLHVSMYWFSFCVLDPPQHFHLLGHDTGTDMGRGEGADRQAV